MSGPSATPLFVDTGAFYARFHESDQNHETATAIFDQIRRGDLVYRPLYTSRFVLAELSRLLLYHAGNETAIRTLSVIRRSESFRVLPVDRETFETACEQFGQYDDQEISLTDHVSAALARENDVEHVFAFDTTDFRTLDFTLVPDDVSAGTD